MKTVEKTTRRIVIELTSEEISKSGFEHLWDEIRTIYPAKSYDLYSVKETIRGMVVEVELRPAVRKIHSGNTHNM